MRFLASRLFFAATFALYFAGSCFAQTPLRVNEAAARIQIRDDDTIVDLRVENPTQHTTPAQVRAELIDPQGAVQIHAEQDASFPPGSTKLRIALPSAFAQNEHRNRQDLLWYRLRYTITPSPSSGPTSEPVVGIFSVGQATPEIFELHVALAALFHDGASEHRRVEDCNVNLQSPVDPFRGFHSPAPRILS